MLKAHSGDLHEGFDDAKDVDRNGTDAANC